MKIQDIKIFSGKNIYSLDPVIKVQVDLQQLNEVETKDVPEFNHRLLVLMPGLTEHFCSKGTKGGFVERLMEGTYFGHVLEHVALELQGLVGYSVYYGKTRATNKCGVYEIIMEYCCPEVALEAIKQGIEIIIRTCAGTHIEMQDIINVVKNATGRSQLGPSTNAIVQAAHRRKIPVTVLGDSLVQLGYGQYQVRIGGTITGRTSCLAADMVGDKQLMGEYLLERGFPTPRSWVAESEREAVVVAREFGFPVVVKPCHGHHGTGVYIGLKKASEIEKAFRKLNKDGNKVLVQEYIVGRQYRLVVVNGNVVAAAERIPPSIIGNGKSSIKELVEKLNCDPLRGEGHELPLTKVKIDDLLINNLRVQQLALDDVLPHGQQVYLHFHANLSLGATAEDVTELVNDETRRLIEEAVGGLGLDVAGVDVIAKDIAVSLRQDGAIIEINAAPGIRMHHFPSKGQPRDVGGAIVNYLFPPGAPARIPIIAVTGTNGKTTTTRMLGTILTKVNVAVGMTTTDGIYIKGKRVVSGDTTGPRSARVVLTDPRVEVAVLETARGGIIRGGLGYDWSDIGIITNITEDHIGQDGIEDIEDLTMVKSLVGEAVLKSGTVVLNADDPRVFSLAQRFRREVIYFSTSSANPIVRRHLGLGGKAVFIINDWLTYAHGNYVERIIKAGDIPATLQGKAIHNIQNALAAAGGAIGLGLTPAQVSQGLAGFNCTLQLNPGRQNFLQVNGVDVLVDYGHNVAAFEQTIQMIEKGGYARLIGVAGVPGDRNDDSVIKSGRVLGRGFHYLFIKEDKDLRGRESGEISTLLRRGAIDAGGPKTKVTVVLDEAEAINEAFSLAQPGDIVVIFYEKLPLVLSLISKLNLQFTDSLIDDYNKLSIG